MGMKIWFSNSCEVVLVYFDLFQSFKDLTVLKRILKITSYQLSEYYASYKQPKYYFNELSRFENPVRMILNHSTMRGNLIESTPVDLSLSASKRIDQNQICISRNFEKFFSGAQKT